MKRPRVVLLVAVLMGTGGCSLLQPAPPAERDAEARLDRGLSALEAGDYRAAFEDLAWVYGHCDGRSAGVRALVALAGLELDPRNEAGRPAVGSDLLGRVIREAGPPRWVRPLAETSYLQALSLGTPEAARPQARPRGAAAEGVVREEERVTRASDVFTDPPPLAVHGCGGRADASDARPRPLPELPGPSFASMLAGLEVQRDSAAARAAALSQELTATKTRLEETERELERIRKTLNP